MKKVKKIMNQRKIKKIKKIVNEIHTPVPITLTYIFAGFLVWRLNIFIKINPEISPLCKNGPDNGDCDNIGDGENFLIGNFAENELACSQHI